MDYNVFSITTAVVCEHSSFYTQIAELLNEINLEPKRVMFAHDLETAHMIITDGAYDFAYQEDIPTFVVAKQRPADFPYRASAVFFPLGKFTKKEFLNCIQEWAEILEELINRESKEMILKEQLEEKRAQVRGYQQRLEMASQLQTQFMKPPTIEGYQTAWYFQSADGMSGDFCIIKEIKERLFIVIGDVVDHGIQAALYGTALKSLILSYFEVYRDQSDLTSLLMFLRNTKDVCNATDIPYVATAILCEIDRSTNMVSLINCGHPLPILVKDNQVAMIDFYESDIVRPLGENTDEVPTKGPVQIPFAPNDALMFYTDGITEVFRGGDKTKDMMNIYSSDRLLSSVEHEITRKEWSPYTILNGVLGDIASYSIGQKSPDDATVLIIQSNPQTKANPCDKGGA